MSITSPFFDSGPSGPPPSATEISMFPEMAGSPTFRNGDANESAKYGGYRP